MKVAVGLPNAVPGTSGEQLIESAGCQELFLFPSSSDPEQVDLLADALEM